MDRRRDSYHPPQVGATYVRDTSWRDGAGRGTDRGLSMSGVVVVTTTSVI